MAIAFRAAGAITGANSGNVASIGLPTGHALNDILILWAVQHDNVASTVTGYTLVGSTTNGVSNTIRIFAKRDGGAEAAPTLTHTSGGNVHCVIAAFSGVDAGLTVAVPGAGSILRDLQFSTGSQATGSVTFAVTAPALTGVVSGDMLGYIGEEDGSDTSGLATGNWTPPTSFTERSDTGRVGTTAHNTSELATLLASGAAGSLSGTANGSGFASTKTWIGCQLALSSSASGGTTKSITPSTGISATSSMSGAVTKLASIKAALNATSSITATVSRFARVVPASISSSSFITATVSRIAAIRPSGISASSAVTGTVSVLRRVGAAIAATSAVSAAVGITNFVKQITAAVTATSTVAVAGSVLPVSPFLLYPHSGTDRIYNIEQWLTVNARGFVPFGRSGLDRIQTIEAWLTANPVASIAFVPFGLTGTDRMWTIESYLLAATGSGG